MSDFSKLESLIGDYIKFRESSEYHEDNDFKQYIFELAIETVEGKNVWKRWRDMDRQRDIEAKMKELKELQELEP